MLKRVDHIDYDWSMPRRRRIHYRNAFYHVMVRGNYRKQIFHDDQDRGFFFKKLQQVTENYLCKIHLFCLMPNHVHLVIEVTEIPLAKVMQSLTSAYARTHNLRHELSGHLFQGRYKAKLIQDDRYLLELCFYIHQNPVKAGLCRSLADYRWSSHFAYVNQEKISWLTTSHINALLEKKVSAEANHYITFMMDKNDIESKPAYCTFNQAGELIIMDTVKLKRDKNPMLALENVPLVHLAEVICKEMGVSMEHLVSDSQARQVTLARSLVFYFGHYHARYKVFDLGILLNWQPDSLAKTLSRQLANRSRRQAIEQLIEKFARKFLVIDIRDLSI